MVDQGRTRGRAETWRPWVAAGRRPALAWPDGFTDFARAAAPRIREWALADVGPGRLVPWLAVAFGFGIVFYFTAATGTAARAALSFFFSPGGGAGVAVWAGRRPVAFPIALAIAAAAAGFATVTTKQAIIAHPVLRAAAWNVD